MIFRHINTSVLILITFLVADSYADCQNKTVELKPDSKFYKISSQDNLDCKFTVTFSVDQFALPNVIVQNTQLKSNDQIVIQQFATYSGINKIVYNSNSKTTDDSNELYPINFTIDITHNDPNTQFIIVVNTINITPNNSSSTSVGTDLAKIIYSGQIAGNSSLNILSPDKTNFTMRVVSFTKDDYLNGLLQKYLVYDGGLFVGSLLEINNVSQSHIVSGQDFSILNTLGTNQLSFDVLISPNYQIDGFVQADPMGNSDKEVVDSYSATNGQSIIHVVDSPIGASTIPTTITGFEFRGNGVLTIHAGCVTTDKDSTRIAVINSTNAADYVPLLLYGSCRTYILTQGVVNIKSKVHVNNNYRVVPGRKGVIMWESYPLPRQPNDAAVGVYLLQAVENDNIEVTYEFAYFDPTTNFTVHNYIRGGGSKDQIESITGSNIAKTVTFGGASYQQSISYDVPVGSVGFMARYTVKKSSQGFQVLTGLLAMLIARFLAAA